MRLKSLSAVIRLPRALEAEIPSLPVQGRAAKRPATDEDMLPFAFADRSRWGGPKKVKRAVTLTASLAYNAGWVNAQD
jgi:hypothetical protein